MELPTWDDNDEDDSSIIFEYIDKKSIENINKLLSSKGVTRNIATSPLQSPKNQFISIDNAFMDRSTDKIKQNIDTNIKTNIKSQTVNNKQKSTFETFSPIELHQNINLESQSKSVSDIFACREFMLAQTDSCNSLNDYITRIIEYVNQEAEINEKVRIFL